MTVPITSLNQAGGGKSKSLASVFPKEVCEDLDLHRGDKIVWVKTGKGWIPTKFIQTK